jgi:hypothetical protein
MKMQDLHAGFPMSEVPADSRHRWFRLRLPGDCRDTQLWAERFFAGQARAFDFYERRRRRAEHPHQPRPSSGARPGSRRRLGRLHGSGRRSRRSSAPRRRLHPLTRTMYAKALDDFFA